MNKPVSIVFEDEPELEPSHSPTEISYRTIAESLNRLAIPENVIKSTPTKSSFLYQIYNEQINISFRRP